MAVSHTLAPTYLVEIDANEAGRWRGAAKLCTRAPPSIHKRVKFLENISLRQNSIEKKLRGLKSASEL
jgi:hypothetical protein